LIFFTMSAFRNFPKRSGGIEFFEEFIPKEIIDVLTDYSPASY